MYFIGILFDKLYHSQRPAHHFPTPHMLIRFSLIFAVLICFFIHTTQAQEIITNQSVLNMHQNKVSSNLIVSKIRASRSNFDVSTNGLLQLLSAKLSDSVIEAMMQSTTMTDILTNTDIINLREANMSRKLMTQKINSSRAQFDMSTNGLIQLKNGKVPDGIQKIMMVAPYAQSSDKPINKSTGNSINGTTRSTAQRPPAPVRNENNGEVSRSLCATWTDKFTKKEVTVSRVILRGTKASNIFLGRGASTIAGVEDMELTLLFRRDNENIVLIMYASKPGVHTLLVERTKTLMLLMDDESVMEFKPIMDSEYGYGFDYSGFSIDSKLCVYYGITNQQLRTLTKKLIKNYRLNTHNRSNVEDTVNPSRAEQVQVAARCMLGEVTALRK